MRWMSGTSSPLQVILLNEALNPYVFSLANHKELLYKLATLCSTGPQRNKWIKLGSREHQHKQCIEVIKTHYGYSTNKAIDVFDLIDSDTIIWMSEQQGVTKETLAKIKLELKTR